MGEEGVDSGSDLKIVSSHDRSCNHVGLDHDLPVALVHELNSRFGGHSEMSVHRFMKVWMRGVEPLVSELMVPLEVVRSGLPSQTERGFTRTRVGLLTAADEEKDHE